MIDWGTVEAEPEVASWLASLDDREFGHAAFHIDLLQNKGPQLGEPYTRQLRGKLRELRFYLGSSQIRVTYFIARGRRIVLLTTIRKQARREQLEIMRAAEAMERCIALGHTTDEEAEED
jgi:hypothetical protein